MDSFPLRFHSMFHTHVEDMFQDMCNDSLWSVCKSPRWPDLCRGVFLEQDAPTSHMPDYATESSFLLVGESTPVHDPYSFLNLVYRTRSQQSYAVRQRLT